MRPAAVTKITCPTFDLGDSRLRISHEMKTSNKLDGSAAPEVIAKAWDDYLHRCGPEAYISARYGSSVRDGALGQCSSSRRSITTPSGGLAQAA